MRRARNSATSAEDTRRRAAVLPLWRWIVATAWLPWLVACSLVREPSVNTPPATAPRPESPPQAAVPDSAPGRALLALAEQQLGAPYRFGGASPDGFDCSGLVRWIHARAGITVPRTAAGQQLEARAVAARELLPGDLVFFRVSGREVDHVGVYAGDGRFVHAPRRGRTVGYDRLDDAWWSSRQAGAGRFWTPGPAWIAPAGAETGPSAPKLPLDGGGRDSDTQP